MIKHTDYFLSGFSLCVLLTISCLAISKEVRPSAPSVFLTYSPDQTQIYPIRLLERALELSDSKYKLTPSSTPHSQKRTLTELVVGASLDVAWSMTSVVREEMLLPIRIPIYKGLIGWRLALVKTERLNQFYGVDSFDKLQAFKPGQIHDWPDTTILKKNGIEVFSSNNFEGLFKMLTSGRIDYFPRSVIEIWQEVSIRPTLNLSIDPHIAIYYPAAMYYFVSRARPDLHAVILEGLEEMQSNGEFDRLFLRHNAQYIAKAKLHRRYKFTMHNPLLPNETPIDNKALWYQLEKKLSQKCCVVKPE